jgi:cell division protein ZapE
MPEWYQQADLLPDNIQLQAAQTLDAMYEGLKAGDDVQGVYLYGPVGRGKSLLTNLLLEKIKNEGVVPHLRVHFHAFMEDIHEQFHNLKDLNGQDPMDILAQRLAEKAKLFCFDEFYVTNIADAMLLGRLFEALFKKNVVVCATSNWPPDELFQGGINRENFLPFIRQIKHYMQPIDLAGGPDYRQNSAADWPWVRVNPSAEEGAVLWGMLSKEGKAEELPEKAQFIEHEGRALRATFGQLCGANVGREYYLDLAANLDVIQVENVPVLDRDEANSALRFITLIDICYENRVRLVLTTQAPVEELCPEGAAAGPYLRAASRLAEMQGWG